MHCKKRVLCGASVLQLDLPPTFLPFQSLMQMQSSHPPPSSQSMFNGSHIYVADGIYTQYNNYGLAAGPGILPIYFYVGLD